jgi:hypothetical protein
LSGTVNPTIDSTSTSALLFSSGAELLDSSPFKADAKEGGVDNWAELAMNGSSSNYLSVV